MSFFKKYASIVVILFSFVGTTLAIEDLEGAADYPKLARVAGSKIIGFQEKQYNELEFATAVEKRKIVSVEKEGQLSRFVYAMPLDVSPLYALKNYQEAFTELGEVKEIYKCSDRDCGHAFGSNFVWSRDRRIDTPYRSLNHAFNNSAYHKRGVYWYASVTNNTQTWYVSVYAARIHYLGTADDGLFKEQTIVHLDVLEDVHFKSALKVIEAAEISSTISQKGHVAIYGLYFDTGQDQLKQTSQSALDEVAKAIEADPDLKLYVVGHTDNVGSLAANQSLSQRRAKSIVDALINNYGIQNSRLSAIGVGLAAPVASNDTEEGRSLNRRVELVKQ